ncbi:MULTISPECIES: response regulator transcription factor [Vibrio]|uniref:Response regulator transcription factor n=1 Tax=Vibrio qingdaonensis TaxID=2829491 RepID=A0A9X3CM08_9VIBR|nr:response regulator transcription factor [Vibrio qingdaonensis]MCW8345624.1 response regulator transcription factor [Vibrio qingdaonensis]
MESQKLLIVEDDVKLNQMLAEYFETQGFRVQTVLDGAKAEKAIHEFEPDLIVLDLMLPGQDGLSICRSVRDNYFGKILMLTASDDDFDHVAALETGANDFVTKPVKPRVLLARIRNLLRKSADEQVVKTGHSLKYGQLVISQLSRNCKYQNIDVSLTDSEFDLLWLLASSPGETLSRDFLTKKLRGIDYDGIDRTIDNRIVTLRKKLFDDATNPKGIITVRGKGYLFVSDGWLG